MSLFRMLTSNKSCYSENLLNYFFYTDFVYKYPKRKIIGLWHYMMKFSFHGQSGNDLVGDLGAVL